MSVTPQAPTSPDPVGHDREAGRYTVDLEIGGMTCASCSTRVERRLNRVPGVTATVNLAIGSAHAEVPDQVDVQALVAAVESAGYTAHRPGPPSADGSVQPGRTADPEHALRGRLLVSAVLSLPVLAISMVPALQFDRWAWVALALTTPVALWGAWPFHRAAAVNARHGASTMDTLVSVGILSAWLWSLWAVLRGGAGEPGMRMSLDWLPWRAGGHPGMPEVYFEVAAVVTTFLLAGRLAEARARHAAGSALRALLDLGAKQATLLVDAPDPAGDPAGPGRRIERRVPVGRLLVGDRFVVRPGERVPTDGVVLDGRGELDTSMLTGEPLPAPAGPGDAVVGGTVNLTGRLEVRATRVGEQTRLAQIARLVGDAQTGKAPVQRLADRVSAVFVPVVGILAVLTLAVWLAATGDPDRAFTAAVAVLIVACPCALGLATPTALLVGTGRAAQLGILVKGPQVLESTRRADVVLLDKTGTLTEGRMALAAVLPADDGADDEAAEARLLTRAAAVEAGSEHPIAAALVRGAAERGLRLPPAAGFATVAGQGVSATVDGLTVTVGRVPADAPEPVREQAAGLESDGATVVAVSWDGAVHGLLAVSDRLKPTSAQAVAELAALGLHPVMLTGDNPGAAARIAARAGIAAADVVAGATPESKLEAVHRLQAEGRVVAMVGDGVNDAAALAAADLGIAMGGGTDVAIQAGDLTLTGGDLRAAATAVRLSRATLRTVRQNLFWAFGYNVAAIPLAALGLLNPMISGAAMAASSVLVVGNSLRLRRFAR